MVAQEIGFLGLGRMGGNMVERILKNNDIKVHIWNRTQEKMKPYIEKGAQGHESIKELIQSLQQSPKIVWMMLPAGAVTEDAFQEILGLLHEGDILIDGANSQFKDTIRRNADAKKKGVRMLDVGVSGGIVAAKTGYPMMIGGDEKTFDFCKPIFESMGIENGFDLVGEGGSGHYVKMVHNAIEYGMMQAIAEGFDLLKNGRFKNLDLLKISKIFNHGCIVDSFLMKMTQQAFEKDADLNYLKPYIEDNGEGKWSAIEAMNFGIPFVVNTYALHARYISRDENSFAFRIVAAQRNEFGGHEVKK